MSNTNFFSLSLFMNAVLHFFILFIILNLLFWIVITKISKEVIYNEVTSNLKKPLEILINKLSDDQKVIVASLPYDDLMRIYKEKHFVVKSNNDSLKYLSAIIITIFFIIVIIFGFIYIKYKSNNEPTFLHILSENLITFLFVGLIEIIFFLIIAINFVPSLPSHIIKATKKIIVNIIDKYIKKNKDNKNNFNPTELLKTHESLSLILSNPVFLINNNSKIETLKNTIIEKFNNIKN